MTRRRFSKGKRTPIGRLMNTGTIHKFETVSGTDTIRAENNTFQTISTKLLNLCAMSVYENMSMEELRFADYRNSRQFSSIPIQTTNVFNFNTTMTSPTSSNSLFDHRPTMSTQIPSRFSFTASAITATTPFVFSSKPNTLSDSSGATNTSTIPSSGFTFRSNETTTTAPFNFAEAVKALESSINNTDKETASTTQTQTHSDNQPSRSPSPETIQTCAECTNPFQIQCFHCSKRICMICAQQHITLVTKEIDYTQKTVNDKISILERLAIAAKERVNKEREKIIQQADTARDEAFQQIDELFEQQKKQLQDKCSQMNNLSLDKVLPYIQRMTNEMKDLKEDNEQLFEITCTSPKIQVQYKH